MSFATLSPDLYDEITSHLVGDRVRGKRRPIALGKVLSLVCKSLRPIGQGLVWNNITMDCAKLTAPPEAIVNFPQAYPHLHPCVTSIVIENEDRCTASIFSAIALSVLNALPHCTNLDTFIFRQPRNLTQSWTRKIYDAVSELEDLCHLVLMGDPILLDEAAIKSLWIGFPVLQSLHLSISAPQPLMKSVTDATSSPPAGTRIGWLKDLNLQVAELLEPEGTKQLTCLVTLALGVCRLTRCRFNALLFNSVTFQWLTFSYNNIRYLSFDVLTPELVEELPNLLTRLPQLGSLVTLSVNRGLDTNLQFDISVKSPVTLVQLLSSIPFSMHLLHIRGIYFVGLPSYRETRLKRSALALIEGPSAQFFLKTSDSQTLTTLKKMKDKKGISRWHRVVEA